MITYTCKLKKVYHIIIIRIAGTVVQFDILLQKYSELPGTIQFLRILPFFFQLRNDEK